MVNRKVLIMVACAVPTLITISFALWSLSVMPHHHTAEHSRHLPKQVRENPPKAAVGNGEAAVAQQQAPPPDQLKQAKPSSAGSAKGKKDSSGASASSTESDGFPVVKASSGSLPEWLVSIKNKLKAKSSTLPEWYNELEQATIKKASGKNGYGPKELRYKQKRSHKYRGNDPDVINQPAECKQRRGRDYEKDPIMYITPRGTGGMEEMECPVKCTFTSDHSKWQEADGMMFAIPGAAGPLPKRKCPLQKGILFSMESESYYGILALDSGYQQWDVLGTTRLESDVPLLYGSHAEYGYMEEGAEKTAGATAVAAISNCGAHNNRLDVLQDLMKHGVSVHSYGGCLHNKDYSGTGNWFKDKVDMLRPYKFILCFENSNVRDYVTEKFSHALVAGTVPIYMGAENIDDFAPSDHSVVEVRDFSSTANLAEYIKFLDAHDDEYQKLLSWKKTGTSKSFEWMMDITKLHSNCRLCMRLKEIFEQELESE